MHQPPASSYLRCLHLACRLLSGMALMAGVLSAASAQETVSVAEVLQLSQRWLDTAVGEQQNTLKGSLRMEVNVGTLDTRLKLAPCVRVEPYLPVGTRLWGRTRIGLRCLEGPTRWNVSLPITVRALGPAWVVKGNLAAGSVLAGPDAMQAEVDWADEFSPVIADPSHWVGQVTARPLVAGQALRQGMIRPAQVFPVGSQVRVLAVGPGFQIATDGQALTPGVVGQQVRVRMDGGKAVSGVVLDVKTVRIEM